MVGSPRRLRKCHIRQRSALGPALSRDSRSVARTQTIGIKCHTMPSHFPRKSQKTNDWHPDEVSHFFVPPTRHFMARRSRFPYNLCTHFAQGATCTRPLTTAFARRCATTSTSATRPTCPWSPSARRSSPWAKSPRPLCFELAKRLKKPPRALAQEIANSLKNIPGVARVEVAGGGYLNLFFDRAAFFRAACEEAGHERAAVAAPDAPKVMVEHTSINPNKAAHIGHLRNAVLGDTFGRILRYAGRRVEVQNYIDNTGVQVADVVLGFTHLEPKSLDGS